MKNELTLLLICLLLVATSAAAKTQTEILNDRAYSLYNELRCPVCQSESIADSDAELAKDLRAMVRERLAAGDTDTQVKDYLAKRYGDAILMQPPVKRHTWLLWFGPLLMLGIGGLLVARSFRRTA